MIIAISQRNIKIAEGANRDGLENDYVGYFEKFGIMLVPIPNVCKDLERYFKNLPIKAVILSGGNDINPSLYGGKRQNEDFSKQRDNTEKGLVKIALKRKLPLLGVCRGAQFINVFFGGKLVQDIKAKIGVNHIDVTHPIKITDKKAAEFFDKNEFVVNSYHKQGIDKNSLSAELKPFAISKDGIIEGVYHPRHAIAGVQWHPERKSQDEEFNKSIINAFLNRELFWKK